MFFTFALTACGNNGESLETMNIESIDPDSNTNTGSTTTSENFKLAVCSSLNFKSVAWPKTMDDFDRNVYAIAMSLTGSFEGSDGWANIANNFDGQGVSLGLFNQNLGQGSLQPLLSRMQSKNLTVMKSFFNLAQFASLESMLNKWKSSSGFTSKATAMDTEFSVESNFSKLDDPAIVEVEEGILEAPSMKASASIQATLNWATSTLYNGSSFKPEWKKSLQNLARSPAYVSEQLSAAEAIHQKAVGYLTSLGFKEMRSYLFLFDIVVQNGGLSSSVINNYKSWAKSNPKATETAKLTRLLELRITSVLSQYKNDVRSRKMSIINGKGTVHGAARDYAKEFCVKNWNISYFANGF